MLCSFIKSEFIMKKHLFLFGAVLTAGILGAPAPATAGPMLYISGNVGVSSFSDINPRYHDSQEPIGTATTDAGIAVLGAVGVKCCVTHIRLEAEIGYQRNNYKQFDEYLGSTHNATGYFTVTSYLANGYYDFHVAGVDPYLTAGIGLASVSAHGINYADAPVSEAITETHSALGYQFGAGVAIPLTKNIAFDARYRYFGTSTIVLENNQGDCRLPGSSFLAGLRVEL